MLYASDLMTKDPIVVLSSDELKDVAKVFIDNNISSAPVENPFGEVLGVVTELNLGRAFLRHYMSSDVAKDRLAHHQELLIEPVFVNEDASIVDVMNEILKAPINRILVMNKMGRLSGVISPKDILYFLVGEQKKFVDLKKDLEKAQSRLKEMKLKIQNLAAIVETYQDLYEDAPTMMHSVDKNGKIIMANKKIHQVLGYKDGELIGKHLKDLYSQSIQHEAVQGLQRIIEDGHHHSTYTTMIRKNGEKVRVDIVSNALKSDDGEFIATISAARQVDSEAMLRALHGTIGKYSEDKKETE